ncbi:glycosyltransferase [Legionella sp. PC997]|uniref:glycosyltransferase n=1 Tax=Legionella sp. PC997 TaxID=2755562 RepID=UPI0015F9D822|nr:glycosyltransferase [Legionella sp. PC997]QMT59659.1 hypothetical protein HBNCFIEN_01025 [Legionella sp. PC997]
MDITNSGFKKTRNHIIISLSLLITTYYIIWRATTFNPDALVFSVLLYAAEVYGWLAALLFYFSIWNPTNRQSIPPKPGLKVDVFIPTLNESTEILRKTILGCINIAYPHKTYLLDDGNRAEVKALAEEMGCNYIARPHHTHAKAGNLNYALTQTEGDFIAIFDADHVPQVNFLDKLLGYFNDDQVAFVQSPQDFYNIDSFSHRIMKNDKLWSEQALFHHVIQPGKDHWNAAFFCGTCGIMRRAALMEIGGFATETVTEDLHTSMKLHSRKWKSVYHNESLAYGIAPSTLGPYLKQWTRWGQGAMQIYRLENPLFNNQLTISQRIAYLPSMLTYMTGLQKLIFYFAPIVVLFTGIAPIKAINVEFLMRFIPYLVFSLLAFKVSCPRYSLLLQEQYDVLKYLVFLKSLRGIVRRNIPFVTTQKSNNQAAKSSMLLAQLIIPIFSVISIIYAVLNLESVFARSPLILYTAIFWTCYNSFLSLTATKFALSKSEKRENFRFPTITPALVSNKPSRRDIAILTDLHEMGASMFCFTELDKDQILKLRVFLGKEYVDIKIQIMNKEHYDLTETKIYSYGVKFISETNADKNKIIAYNFLYNIQAMFENPRLSKKYDNLNYLFSKPLNLISFNLFGFYSFNENDMRPFYIVKIEDNNKMQLFIYQPNEHSKAIFQFFTNHGIILYTGKIISKEPKLLNNHNGFLISVVLET